MNDQTKFSDVKVGIFVVTALMILILGLLWTAGSTLFRGNLTDYWVLMKNSGAISVGDGVRIAGVKVGGIKQVKLHPGKEWPVRLRIALNSDIPIKTDSTARIAKSGLLAAAFLEVDLGTPDAPLLPPEGKIRGQDRVGFEEALAKVSELSGHAVSLMDKTANILDRVSQDLPVVVKKISSLTDDLNTALGPGGSRLARVLDTAEYALGSTGDAMSVINANRTELGAAVSDLRDAASNIKAFSQLIKERPYSLVRITPEPERRPGQGP